MSNVLLGIPCYNCSSQIPRVLSEINKTNLESISEILIIDNLSTDNTAEVIMKTLPELKFISSKATLIRNDSNLGLGGSQKKIFSYGINKNMDFIIVLHGDDQASVADISHLIKCATEENKTVLGSRFMRGSELQGYQATRIFGNRVLNIIFSIITKTKVYDLGSGLNIFRSSDLKRVSFSKLSNNFNFNSELLLQFISSRADFKFFPITWRETDQVSNARNFNVAFSMLMSLFRWKKKRH